VRWTHQAVSDIATMGNIDDSLRVQRLTMTCSFVCGTALILASIGLYGVMALIVSQRTREMGIGLPSLPAAVMSCGLVLVKGCFWWESDSLRDCSPLGR